MGNGYNQAQKEVSVNMNEMKGVWTGFLKESAVSKLFPALITLVIGILVIRLVLKFMMILKAQLAV